MSVGTLAAEVAKLSGAQEAGVSALGARDRVILKLVKTYSDAASNAALASGKILVGNASNVATAVTPSGVVAVSTAGVFSFGSGFAFIGTNATTDSNGEIAISGMTSNGAAVVTPQESTSAPHIVPAAGKITVYAAGTTNVIASKKFGVLVIAK